MTDDRSSSLSENNLQCFVFRSVFDSPVTERGTYPQIFFSSRSWRIKQNGNRLIQVYLENGWWRLTLAAWPSGRTPVSDFPCPTLDRSWQVTTCVGKPSAIGQPTRPIQPFILFGSINWVVRYFIGCVPVVPSGEWIFTRLSRCGWLSAMRRVMAAV